MREVRGVYRKLKPDIAHHVAVQAAVVGSLAATGLPIVCLNAITGLGTTFLGNSRKARMARPLVTLLLRALLNRPRSAVLVQNADDRAEIERLGVTPDRISLVPGSGVDIERDAPLPRTVGPDHRRVRRAAGRGQGHPDADRRPRHPAATAAATFAC